ncbi:MAG: hypothetical protein P1U87_09820 [Verrucomicrobiales bacterium]|nr:hypothetical protein [Verrucomicrobiales bacterium]
MRNEEPGGQHHPSRNRLGGADRPLHEMPEAKNGGLYCFRDSSRLWHLSIFRDGSMAMGGRTVRLPDLQEKLLQARSNTEGEWKGIRLSVHPDAPLKAIRTAYEASREANLDALCFAVVVSDR